MTRHRISSLTSALAGWLFFAAGVSAQDALRLQVQLPPGSAPGDPASLQLGAYVRTGLRASAEGKLDAWLDFDRDGEVTSAGEQIFAGFPLRAGESIASFRVPVSAVLGSTRARFRLSLNGGLSPNEEAPGSDSVDLEAQIVAPSLARDIEARYARGQVWVTWRYDLAAAPQTFEIYRAPRPFTTTSEGERAGKLFPTEYSGSHLAQEMRDGFGAAAPDHYTVPTGSGDGRRTLDPGQGLFVGTVRRSAEWWYAVVPGGLDQVPNESIARTPVREIFDRGDPPTCHFQASGEIDEVRVTFLSLWVDGDQDRDAGRPDFPVFANAAKRGSPHPLIVMEPIGGIAAGAQAPACLAFHSGDAKASMWLPGDKNAFRSVGLLPQDGYVIAMEDRLWSLVNGAPDHDNTNWLGYVPSFDPFTDILAAPASDPSFPVGDPNQFPSDDAVVEPYTQDRLLWTLDWLIAQRGIDPDRVSLLGHSGGAKGALNFSHAQPERLASVVLFCPGLGDIEDSTLARKMHGSREQNLWTTLTNHAGLPVRMRDTFFLTTSLSPERDTPFTRVYLGKREENWAVDDDRNFLNDVLEEARRADALGTGVAFSWDLREHGVDKWTFAGAQERLGPDLPAGWTSEDYWIPTLRQQTRRDDADYLARYRARQSYPAFFHLETYPGHGGPGTVVYDGSVPFDPHQPYDGTVTAEDGFPPFTGDDRGTWGGHFDWRNDAEDGPEALVDEPDRWGCTVFLEGNRSPSGYPLAEVDEAPAAELMADIAIRRPQRFLPAPGSTVAWRVLEVANGAELQSGRAIVDGDGLVVLSAIRVRKDPGVRIEVRDPGATPAASFHRGDANGDQEVDIADPLRTLFALYVDASVSLLCPDAADANDDGRVQLADALVTLHSLFLGGPELPPPGARRCGPDPSPDRLPDCAAGGDCGSGSDPPRRTLE